MSESNLVTWQGALDMASIYLGLLDDSARVRSEGGDPDTVSSTEQYRIWQSMHQMDPVRMDPSLSLERNIQKLHYAAVKEATLAVQAVLAAAQRDHGIDPRDLLAVARRDGPVYGG